MSETTTDAAAATDDAADDPGTKLTPRGRRTRNVLVEAARVVFERDGFLNARITDIAQEAGVAHGSFYTYFPSKEDAFRAVVLEVEVAMRARPSSQDDPWLDIVEANRSYLSAYRDHSRLMMLWEEVATFNDDFAELITERMRSFTVPAARRIERLQTAGLADARLDPWYAANALANMVNRFAYSWLGRGEEFDFDTAVEQLSLIWANAIGLSAEARADE